jgi:ribosomal protein L16 Arg81 hydroxylase
VVKNLYKTLKEEIISFERFDNNEIVVIDRTGHTMWSWYANQKLSYTQYVSSIKNYSAIKVEGLEKNQNIKKFFGKLKIKDIHLFYSPKTDYSFGWHHDTTNVMLYVIKGRKRVQIKNKIYILKSGDCVSIPKGHKHRVFNQRDTWAISIGLK